MKKIIYALALLIGSYTVDAQQEKVGFETASKSDRKDSLTIYFLDISSNKLLTREIKKYIRERSDSSAYFKNGYGFITVEHLKLSPHAPVRFQEMDRQANDASLSFTLSSTSYPLSDKYSLTRFPSYYSFVDNRLVLLYNESLEWFTRPVYTKNSRNQVEALVLKSIQMALSPDFLIYDPFKRTSLKLSKEERQSMAEFDILSRAGFTINHSKTVTQKFDQSVVYSY